MMVFPSYVMSSVIGFSLLSPSPVHLNVVGFPASTFDEHCKIIFMDQLLAPTLLNASYLWLVFEILLQTEISLWAKKSVSV